MQAVNSLGNQISDYFSSVAGSTVVVSTVVPITFVDAGAVATESATFTALPLSSWSVNVLATSFLPQLVPSAGVSLVYPLLQSVRVVSVSFPVNSDHCDTDVAIKD